MSDVARLAQVSEQTVSRVLKGSPKVRPATRDRVLAAIRELGYRPNAAARALASGRTRTLGVVTHGHTLFGPASALFAIETAAETAGYRTTIASVSSLESDVVVDAVERLRHEGVEGVLVTVPQADARRPLSAIAQEFPLVAIESRPSDQIVSVGVNQRLGAARVTRHLLDLGHRTVHHVSGPPHWLAAQQRIEGWRESLARAGAEVPDVSAGDWSPLSGYEQGVRLARLPDVTAIFAANDQMALGILRAFREAGRAVPADVSVAGFDDTPEAPYFAPPLTTVRQDFNEIGRRGVASVLALIEGKPTEAVLLEPDLVVRDSTARAARLEG